MTFRKPCKKCLVQPSCTIACDEYATYRKDYPVISALIASVMLISTTTLSQAMYWVITLYYPLPHWLKVIYSILTLGIVMKLFFTYVRHTTREEMK